jgi:ATP-dependent Lon protease
VNELITATLPVLTLTGGVVLPQMVLTIALETDEARAAIDAAVGADTDVLLVPKVGDQYATVGTVAAIDQAGELPGGGRAVFVRGRHRARLMGAAEQREDDSLWVEAQEVVEEPPTAHQQELAREYRALLENILELRRAPQIAEFVRSVDTPSALADIAGYSPDVSLEHKVELLETLDLSERLEKVVSWARETLAELELKAKVRADVAENLEQHQREAILRQQLAAIRKELGETEGDLVEDYRSRVAERELPDHVATAVSSEIEKLERTPEQAAEHGWIRTWLDTVLEVPWDRRAEERLDLRAAREQLDADHTGLEKVKERLVEHLAVRKLRLEREGRVVGEEATGGRSATGAILALVGPPGVGKTSLGQSVAEAMGRPYVRVALGGLRDEAEIRGHRRTYVGARPGRIVKAIEEAGAMNPVMVLDEIDKVGADWRGDPSAALLEVLDPAQNSTFRDHYLELDLDLSDVVFIATANVLDTIPGPLLDRLEVIQLDGYTTDEKIDIARDHLVGRQRETAGLLEGEVDVTDAAVRAVTEGYTREPGVRNLERRIASIMRKVAAGVAVDDESVELPVTIDPDAVRVNLGRPRHRVDEERPSGVPGVATGLAVTGAGGDVLLVEVARVDHPSESHSESSPAEDRTAAGSLELTGQLGEVMQESGRIALSFLRSTPDVLTRHSIDDTDDEVVRAVHEGRFHVHFPAGAVPKDGPSAGITMTTALVSALTGRPMRHEVAMTGEVSLHGRVLPIGGVKQKLLAAHRAGIEEVILPAANEADLDDVPDEVLEALQVHLVDDVRTALDLALEPLAA